MAQARGRRANEPAHDEADFATERESDGGAMVQFVGTRALTLRSLVPPLAGRMPLRRCDREMPRPRARWQPSSSISKRVNASSDASLLGTGTIAATLPRGRPRFETSVIAPLQAWAQDASCGAREAVAWPSLATRRAVGAGRHGPKSQRRRAAGGKARGALAPRSPVCHVLYGASVSSARVTREKSVAREKRVRDGPGLRHLATTA
jgi:hypothetical protein